MEKCFAESCRIEGTAIASIAYNENIFILGNLRPLCCLFSFFSNKLKNKTVDFSGIRTRIDGVEGENADHLTKALIMKMFKLQFSW